MSNGKLPVVILHGWSGSSESLQDLSEFLKKSEYNVVNIWLSDYMSMNDEITINDLGQAMGEALKANKIPQDPHSFDAIVHSTGGLVIRSYLKYYFYGKPENCPVKRLVMLAPANFGSPLARTGRSMLGRLMKGWTWNHMFETGTRILQALDMGSPISYQLAHDDLFNENNQIFRTKNLYTTILVGSSPYSGPASAMHHNGSDGTVYASTANLNARSIKLDLYPSSPKTVELPRCYDPIAFGVLFGHNHQTIVSPNKDKKLAELLLKSLSIESDSTYKKHTGNLIIITKDSFKEGMQTKKTIQQYHQYQNIAIRVHDQFGESIKDYFVEFYQNEGDPKDKVMEKIQADILEKVYPYQEDPGYRSLIFDTTDLDAQILNKNKQVGMSIFAAPISSRISYLNPFSCLPVADSTKKDIIAPNTTLMVDVELYRIQSEEVFKFNKA